MRATRAAATHSDVNSQVFVPGAGQPLEHLAQGTLHALGTLRQAKLAVTVIALKTGRYFFVGRRCQTEPSNALHVHLTAQQPGCGRRSRRR